MNAYSERDQKVIWHPYTQMLNAQTPIPIVRGHGTLLFDDQGKSYIDAISSWWTNLHGHAHPYIAEELSKQFNELDHVIFAGFTHPSAIELAERILNLLPDNQKKAFYSDNGSTAVEVALKMAIQYRKNSGEKRSRILAFTNAYHGDTFGAMSVSGRSAFTKAFDDQLFEVDFFIAPTQDNAEQSILELKELLKNNSGQYNCFIYEPLVQGAGGMLMHSAANLEPILQLCREEDILCIADEVMTGFGRTGPIFASSTIHPAPDLVCLSKGITGGIMPLGMTTCTDKIYNAFLSSDSEKTFFHGHSYTANPLACRAGLASLDLLLRDSCTNARNEINTQHIDFSKLLEKQKGVRSVRTTGTILAIELQNDEKSGYFNSGRNSIYNHFLKEGVLMRPLGNVIYVLAPYCITQSELQKVYGASNSLLTDRP